MAPAEAKNCSYDNQDSIDSACQYCAGVVRHQPWCVTQSAIVAYAYVTAIGAAPLSEQDTLFLHALGVTWTDSSGFPCQELGCKLAAETEP
jgi:hypothetical protein